MSNIKPKMMTDPYCPLVGTMPLDDTPFIIEGSDKFPTGNTEVSHVVPRNFHHCDRAADAHK